MSEPALVRDALDAARHEMGFAFITTESAAVERELMEARHFLDRARLIAADQDPELAVRQRVESWRPGA